MNIPPRFVRLAVLLTGALAPALLPAAPPVPDPLKPWADWATWDNPHRDCPTPYFDAENHVCFWPSRLSLAAEDTGGRFELGVTVFHESWVPLPGGDNVWPLEVKVDGAARPVIAHDGSPAVQLSPGVHRLEGVYRWNEIPLHIPLPRQIGILSLTLKGKAVDAPAWDASGQLWLKRDGSSEETTKDFLSVKVYAAIDDGIPLWLHTQVELIVSGKSREEDIGSVLPEGWKLSAVKSPLPVAIDDAGRLKAQVRAGKWTITVEAFRLDDPKEIKYAADARPATEEELFAFRADPNFRMVDITGATSIDVSQTTFPEAWRNLPVYRWDTAAPFQIVERMRGMGVQKPEGLKIRRTLWLDENGRGLTFRDFIAGRMQQIWRLDAAEGQNLGSVRSNGQGQLITLNPQTSAPGVEIRTRDLNLEATGRMERGPAVYATGWRADADALTVVLNLPPGWRLFALFGSDWVHGDWLTAWTLLDLFLLLIFTLAVFRLWGFLPAVLAFLAFGLSYHEAGAPRYIWLALLLPLALLRVIKEGWPHHLLVVWKWLTVAILVLILVPFLSAQVQQALYPQLERIDGRLLAEVPPEMNEGVAVYNNAPPGGESDAISSAPVVTRDRGSWNPSSYALSSPRKENLLYDAKARIQTGPGVPDWTWRTVSFGWNGPVSATQKIHPVLISLGLERILTVIRIVLLLALAFLLLNAQKLRASLFRVPRQTAALFLAALCLLAPGLVHAQYPDKEMLETLRQRLLKPSDAYPTAADIPSVSLALKDKKISMDVEIHAALRTAVPLPGRLPAWSPVTVLIDGKPEAALRRDDGYLWVVIPEGVHRVHVEGLLGDATEWEWIFQLKPRQVTIDAPGWTVSGVRPDGVPEQQVFFALKQKSTAGEASYDRQDFQTVALIERHIELGLVWQANTTVSRLSPAGKAIALRVPLLPGENVLSSNVVVKDGFIEVRLGANEASFSWESEISVAQDLKLATRADDSWVERWYLTASPVWNVSISGLPPIFKQDQPELIPVWHPWPGESVALAISRPEAIAGATVTVSKGTHEIALGKRQRVSKLDLTLRSSLGEDFLVDLPDGAEVTSLTHNKKDIPVRKDGTKLIIPLTPGEQTLELGWKTNLPLGFRAEADAVRLPVESANVDTVITVPENRWVLWTNGPLRGPAVRFWIVLLCSLIATVVLGRLAYSPLRTIEWMLLALGLTQVPLPVALIVVGWLFLLVWRGKESYILLPATSFNLLQVVLIGLTGVTLCIFIAIVAEGLLGSPEMFIIGNDSTRTDLRWYQARCDQLLPQPGCLSVSIWWYRILMLGWALWLAAALIRWLRWGWSQFNLGGYIRRAPVVPPPMPGSAPSGKP